MYNLTLTGWRVNKTLLNYCQNRLKQITFYNDFTLFQKRSFKGAETITCFGVCLILFKGSHISWHRGLHCKLPPFTINNSDVQNMHERFVSFLKRILKVMDFISLLSILYHYDNFYRHEEAMQQVLIVFTPLLTPVLRITKLRFGLWQQSC